MLVAAWTAQADVLELLLEAGADVNATDEAGATALLRAATFEEKVRLLVARGAQVRANSQLSTPLILAARKPGNSRTVRFLLDRGAEVNVTNLFGATALMAATAAGDVETVRMLLDAGAEVNAMPNLELRRFHLGRRSHRVDVGRLSRP